LRSVIADSQYSDGKLRNVVDKTVIPYRANQKRDVKGLLRVDKKFRAYGPDDEKRNIIRGLTLKRFTVSLRRSLIL